MSDDMKLGGRVARVFRKEWLPCVLSFALATLALAHGCDENSEAHEERKQNDAAASSQDAACPICPACPDAN